MEANETETKKVRSGRPRNEEATASILSAALSLMEEVGFKAVTIEGIAERAGHPKTTVYRRWPSTWAVILDAFMEEVAPALNYERKATLRETVRADLKEFAAAMRGRAGRVFSPLLGVAQFNQELRDALWTRYVGPRRALAIAALEAARAKGEMRPGIEPDALIDALYGSVVYKLLMPHGPISDAYVDALVDCVFDGAAAPAG